MDAAEYRRICASPDVLSRGTIEATHRVLGAHHGVLSAKVRNVLGGSPMSKPPHHDAGSHSDHFRISLPCADVEAIVDALGECEAQAVIAKDPRVSVIVDLLDRWNRVLQHLSV